MKHWVCGVINDRAVRAMPIMTYPGLTLAGRTIMQVVTDGESQFRCIRALSERYPSLAAVTMMDLSVEAEAFGSRVRFSEFEVPTVVGSLVNDPAAAAALAVPPVGAGRTDAYILAARLASESIGDRPVFGGQIGPFSLAARLMDMTEIMLTLVDDPDLVHEVLEKATAFLTEYARAFKAAGTNGVIIAEPAAGLLSPTMCDAFSSEYVRRIVSAVQDEGFAVILHNCGNTVKQVKSMASTGAAGLHFGNAVKMGDILPQAPPDRLVFGNIDPAGVFRHGTAEEMRLAVRALRL